MKLRQLKTGLGTLIVTGSSGLIGRVFLDCVGERYTGMGFDRKEPPHPPPKTAHVIACDLSSGESVYAALDEVLAHGHRRIASILHLAVYYSFASLRGSVTSNIEPWRRSRSTSIRPLWDSAIHEQMTRAESYRAGLPCDPAEPFGSLSLATRVMESSRVPPPPLTPSFTMVPASPRIILTTCS